MSREDLKADPDQSHLSSGDERWHRTQCELATKARTNILPTITNLSMSLGEALSLIGKVNATPIRRYLAGQLKMIGIVEDHSFTVLNGREFRATLEYSPLGWPESEEPPERADLNVLFQQDMTKGDGRREFL